MSKTPTLQELRALRTVALRKKVSDHTPRIIDEMLAAASRGDPSLLVEFVSVDEYDLFLLLNEESFKEKNLSIERKSQNRIRISWL